MVSDSFKAHQGNENIHLNCAGIHLIEKKKSE